MDFIGFTHQILDLINLQSMNIENSMLPTVSRSISLVKTMDFYIFLYVYRLSDISAPESPALARRFPREAVHVYTAHMDVDDRVYT
jgi:hypothetical protein